MARGSFFWNFFCWEVFQVVFADFWSPWKTWKSTLDDPPWKPFHLGPCPDDRAQNSVQDSLKKSSVRPNPTLVFSKIRSQFWPPQYRPKPRPSYVVWLTWINKSPPEIREVFVWQENYWFRNQTRGKGCFPYFRWWHFLSITQDKGQKARPHIVHIPQTI